MRNVALNTVFCFAIALFLTAIGVGGTFIQNLTISLAIGFSCLGVGIIAHPMLSQVPFPGKIVTIVIVVAIGSFVGTHVGFYLINDPALSEGKQGISMIQAMTIGLLFGAIISYFFHSRMAMAESELVRAKQERQLAEAELKLLQAQIEPHFLFNTLANVRSLVDSDPAKAGVMLDDFNHYLRASLSHSRSSVSTIEREMEFIRAYLDIQSVRMGERLEYSITAQEGLGNKPFPVMLIQPLVENAVKHGLEPKVDGGRIDVKFYIENGTMRIDVADTGIGLPDAVNESVGLGNVKARLRSIYGEKGKLELCSNGRTIASITVPAES